VHLEQHHRINRRTTIVGTVEIFDFVSNEIKVNNSIDFAQQVIFGHEFFNADKFHTRLFVVMFS